MSMTKRREKEFVLPSPDAPLPVDSPAAAGHAILGRSERHVRLVSIPEIPLLDGDPPGYIGRHVDIQFGQAEGVSLRRLCDALDRQGARLVGGTRIISPAHAVKWLLERLAAAAGD